MNDASLPDADKADLLAWFEAGAAEGDAADAPLARAYPKDWAIGKPDAVFELPKAVDIKATGVEPYHNYFVETNFTEDKCRAAHRLRLAKLGD